MPKETEEGTASGWFNPGWDEASPPTGSKSYSPGGQQPQPGASSPPASPPPGRLSPILPDRGSLEPGSGGPNKPIPPGFPPPGGFGPVLPDRGTPSPAGPNKPIAPFVLHPVSEGEYHLAQRYDRDQLQELYRTLHQVFGAPERSDR